MGITAKGSPVGWVGPGGLEEANDQLLAGLKHKKRHHVAKGKGGCPPGQVPGHGKNQGKCVPKNTKTGGPSYIGADGKTYVGGGSKKIGTTSGASSSKSWKHGKQGGKYGYNSPSGQYFPSPLDGQNYGGGDGGQYGITVNQRYWPSPLDGREDAQIGGGDDVADDSEEESDEAE